MLNVSCEVMQRRLTVAREAKGLCVSLALGHHGIIGYKLSPSEGNPAVGNPRVPKTAGVSNMVGGAARVPGRVPTPAEAPNKTRECKQKPGRSP
ncbi:hypothetical protein QQF64_001373 [Cirrhinus molitorella]|uniref:Uncharacterized protein n=1 Tax=Cirrhinus molitorella TaxID=172907 RepID=A0ABR3NZV8_9TELE